MMSTKAVELTNLMNSDLTWKAVVKGSRSATRRTKKSSAGKEIAYMGAAERKSVTDEGVGVSDFEKCGVAVLGRHFGNKTEHVPIKKRRFMFSSSSSPSKNACSSIGLKKKIPTVEADTFKPNHGKRSHIEDFSGIEILADVACNGSFGDDIHRDEANLEECQRKESSLASFTPEESHQAVKQSSGEVMVEEIPIGSSTSTEFNESLQSAPVLSGHNSPERETKDNIINVSSKQKHANDIADKKVKDDRLHWDLNLSMDAWEQPYDNDNKGNQIDIVKHMAKSKNLHGLDGAPGEVENVDISDESGGRMFVSGLHGCVSMPSEVTELLSQPSGLDKEEETESPEILQGRPTGSIGTMGCLDPAVSNAKGSKKVSSPGNCFTDSVNTSDEKYQCSTVQNGVKHNAALYEEIANSEKCGKSDLCTMDALNDKVDITGENMDAMPPEETCLESFKDGSGSSAKIAVAESALKEDIKVEKYDAASPCTSAIDVSKSMISDPQVGSVKCIEKENMDQNTAHATIVERLEIDNDVKDEFLVLQAQESKEKCGIVQMDGFHQAEPIAAKLKDEIQLSIPNPEEELVSLADCKCIVGEAPGPSDTNYCQEHKESVTNDFQVHKDSEENVYMVPMHSHLKEGISELNSYEREAYVGTFTGSSLCKENAMGSCLEDYESDVSRDDKACVSGRENYSVLQAGYDSQFEDGELRETDMCWEENDGDVEHVDYGSEPEVDRDFENDDCSDGKIMDGEAALEPAIDKRIGTSGFCPSKDASGKGSLTLKSEPNECTTSDNHAVSGDLSLFKGSPRGSGSQPARRDLPSRVEGSLISQPLLRGRSTCLEDSYNRDGRNFGSYKFLGRDRSSFYMHGKSPGRRNFGHWDSKNRYSPPIYNVPHSSGRPRPKSIVEGRGHGNISEFPHLRRQFLTSPDGPFRGISRSSPGARDDLYGIHSGSSPGKDNISPERRFRRYPEGYRGQGVGRPIIGNSECRGRLQHHRRDRSNSPASGRFHTYKKSRSRSRSRSPGPWHRNHRSVNFRPDSRVQLPFQKRFPAEQEMAFMSSRNRWSPPLPRNSRWFDDRTGRVFRPSQRFDSMPTLRRVSSEEQFRQSNRPRRHPNMPGGGRGCIYGGSDQDNTKNHGNRYDVHRVRRYEIEDGMRRLRFSSEHDSFVANSRS